MKKWLWLLAALTLLTAACGGGGAKSSNSSLPAPQFPTQPLFISTTALDVGMVSVPYNQSVAVAGGVAPYTFSLQGTLPAGITFSSGQFSGTPTSAGAASVTLTASDASTPAMTTARTWTLAVITHQNVRNDNVTDANVIPCCGIIHASFSPYSTAAGVAKPDEDYYKITATPGDRVQVLVSAVGKEVDTDTTLQILDSSSGSPLFSCKLPPFVNTTFSSVCINDDRSDGTTDSALQLQVPQAGTFTIRAVDFARRARPEMTYDIKIEKLP
jgi:hypothetical protein